MYLEIDEGFEGHRKTLRFRALMKNPMAGMYLLRLWTWACRSAPDGDLSGMDPADIEIAVGYQDLDGACYAAMVASGFIDTADGCPAAIHNWAKRTGGAITRMEARAEAKRIYRLHVNGGDCGGPSICTACKKEGRSQNRPVPSSGLSSPAVVDIPTKSSPVQSSPVQSSSGEPRAHEDRVEEPARHEPRFVVPLDSVLTANGLQQAIRVAVEREHPEKGFWRPGRFAVRDLLDFLPHPDTAEAAEEAEKTIRRRIVAFSKLTDQWVVDEGWSVRAFVDRWATLDGGTGPPKTARERTTARVVDEFVNGGKA